MINEKKNLEPITCDKEKNFKFMSLIWTINFTLHELNENINSNVEHNVRLVVICDAFKQSLSIKHIRAHTWLRWKFHNTLKRIIKHIS